MSYSNQPQQPQHPNQQQFNQQPSYNDNNQQQQQGQGGYDQQQQQFHPNQQDPNYPPQQQQQQQFNPQPPQQQQFNSPDHSQTPRQDSFQNYHQTLTGWNDPPQSSSALLKKQASAEAILEGIPSPAGMIVAFLEKALEVVGSNLPPNQARMMVRKHLIYTYSKILKRELRGYSTFSLPRRNSRDLRLLF
jgi:hypothetical protein